MHVSPHHSPNIQRLQILSYPYTNLSLWKCSSNTCSWSEKINKNNVLQKENIPGNTQSYSSLCLGSNVSWNTTEKWMCQEPCVLQEVISFHITDTASCSVESRSGTKHTNQLWGCHCLEILHLASYAVSQTSSINP